MQITGLLKSTQLNHRELAALRASSLFSKIKVLNGWWRRVAPVEPLTSCVVEVQDGLPGNWSQSHRNRWFSEKMLHFWWSEMLGSNVSTTWIKSFSYCLFLWWENWRGGLFLLCVCMFVLFPSFDATTTFKPSWPIGSSVLMGSPRFRTGLLHWT